MKYFLGFLISIALIIGVFILILRGFSGHSTPKNAPAPLLDYANTNVQMEYTVDGPINADQTHQGVRITVGQDSTIVEIMQGYNNNIVQSKTYANNEASYAEFLRALDLAGYTKGKTNASQNSDERGYCPNGDRYSYDITDGAETRQHYWSTSCGSQGNFQGVPAQVRSLFQQQVPDYNELTSSLAL